MDVFEFERLTEGMTPQERSDYFNGMSKRKRNRLIRNTFDFMEAMGYGRKRNAP